MRCGVRATRRADLLRRDAPPRPPDRSCCTPLPLAARSACLHPAAPTRRAATCRGACAGSSPRSAAPPRRTSSSRSTPSAPAARPSSFPCTAASSCVAALGAPRRTAPALTTLLPHPTRSAGRGLRGPARDAQPAAPVAGRAAGGRGRRRGVAGAPRALGHIAADGRGRAALPLHRRGAVRLRKYA